MVPDYPYLEGQLVQSDLPRSPLHQCSRLSPFARVLRVRDTPSTRLRAMPPVRGDAVVTKSAWRRGFLHCTTRKGVVEHGAIQFYARQ